MGEILVGKYSRKIVKLERSFLVGKIPFKLEKKPNEAENQSQLEKF